MISLKLVIIYKHNWVIQYFTKAENALGSRKNVFNVKNKTHAKSKLWLSLEFDVQDCSFSYNLKILDALIFSFIIWFNTYHSMTLMILII